MEMALVSPLLPNTIFKILFFYHVVKMLASPSIVLYLLHSHGLHMRTINLPSVNPLSSLNSLNSCITFLYCIKTPLINMYYLNIHVNGPSITILPFHFTSTTHIQSQTWIFHHFQQIPAFPSQNPELKTLLVPHSTGRSAQCCVTT